MEGTLTIQEQIYVLKCAKKLLAKKEQTFTCVAVRSALMSIGIMTPNSNHSVRYVKLLTFDNALSVCVKQKLKKPKHCGAWWVCDEASLKSRLAFVNWMIKQLKAQL